MAIARLILILLTAAGLLAVAIAWVMARMLVRPPRMTDGKAAWILKRISPGDLGLTFRPLWFTVRDHLTADKLRLAAWWIPNPTAAGRCIILLHGYADAKVGAIAWAPLLHALGWNILAIDTRAHGESDGKMITAGYLERHDLDQALNQLRAELPQETRQLVLFGLSYGTAIASATAMLRDDLAGVILDSPVADYQHTAAAHFDLLGWPRLGVDRLALRFAGWMIGAPFGVLRPVDLIPQLPCPIMLIQPGQDCFVSPRDMNALLDAMAGRTAFRDRDIYWLVPDSAHLLAYADKPEEYREQVARFLSRILVADISSAR